jgi:heat shock protein HtpX
MGTRSALRLDRLLVARMLLAAVLTPLIVAAGVVALVLLAPFKLVGGFALASIMGAGLAVRERRARVPAVELTPAAAPELHALVERLCVVADLPKPRLVLERERQPNSWVVSLGRSRAQLHVTEGLLERLEPAELEGVIAHELAHIAQRDAAVMTVVGGPAAVLLAGGGQLSRIGGFWLLQMGGVAAFALGWLGRLGTLSLSRHRELAADAGAAALTGNPAALASALTKVSAGLVAVPREDLRAASARDSFHLLPAGDEQHRVLSTHPSLRERIARLERLEARLQRR